MYKENDNFIDKLREEALDVKSCFTKFSFQAIAFSTILLGAIIKFQPSQPYVAFASLLIIFVLLTVCKVGNYKFASANRHYGFELYLDFLKTQNQDPPFLLNNIGWESALRAWRVVQPTIFSEIYYTKLNTRWWHFLKRWNYNKIKKEIILNEFKKELATNNLEWHWYDFRNRKKYYIFKKEHQWWFNPTSLVNVNKAKWYPGSYLNTMQKVLQGFAIISIIPLVLATIQFQLHPKFKEIRFFLAKDSISELTIFTAFIVIISIIVLIINIRHINTRRKVLESGLLSIHSCAVIWQVVSLAHFRAINNSGNNQNIYLKKLSEEAAIIKQHISDIYIWINSVDPSKSICAVP